MDRIEFQRDGNIAMYLGTDENGVYRGRALSLSAIASIGEILGYTDAIDVIDATAKVVQADVIDPETGENFWTEMREILGFLEQAREDAAMPVVTGRDAIRAYREALEAGADKATLRRLARNLPESPDRRSPELVGALAVHQRIREISGEVPMGECLVAQSQKRLRGLLGLPAPTRPPSSCRGTEVSCEVAPSTEDAGRTMSTEERQQVRDALQACYPDCGPDCPTDHMEERRAEIQKRRRRYCHGLTSHDRDPLEPEPENPKAPPTTNDVLARYRKEAA